MVNSVHLRSSARCRRMTSFRSSLDSVQETLRFQTRHGRLLSDKRQMMEMTREEIQAEIEEKSKDLEVFSKARELIRARVTEVADSKSALTPLPNWSGTDAVLGSLDLSIHAMERTLEELRALERRSEDGRPRLRLVTDEEEN